MSADKLTAEEIADLRRRYSNGESPYGIRGSLLRRLLDAADRADAAERRGEDRALAMVRANLCGITLDVRCVADVAIEKVERKLRAERTGAGGGA